MHSMTDIHCHMLPCVDDGAKNEKMAVRMIRESANQGVQRIILTPHYRLGMFETDQSVIDQRFRRLCNLNKKIGSGVRLYLGRECHRQDDMSELFQQGVIPTLAGSKYVLIEFSHTDDFMKMRKTIYNLVVHGFFPIIAHGERYPELIKELGRVEEIRRLGAKIQVTSAAVYGKHGLRLKMICRKLIKEDFVDFIGSDAHDMESRAPDLGCCAEFLEKKKGKKYARRILEENPGMILEERIVKHE